MLTKCVAACIVSGALASVILPGGPLVTCTEAEAPPPARAVGNLPTQPARRAPAPLEKTVPSRQEAALPPTAPAHGKKRKSPAKRLGTFTVRAYTHYQHPPNKTATGTLPRAGRTVAVDPRVIPLGSRIHVEGIGELVAEDTGAKIKGRSLDLFLPSVTECVRFGRRQRDVYLIVD